jgi:hypothetical protein
MFSHWLSCLFNAKAIIEKVKRTELELAHNERDHSYSGGTDVNHRNLRLLRSILEDNPSLASHNKNKPAFHFKNAVSYLKKDGVLSWRERQTLKTIVFCKKLKKCMKLNLSPNIH